MSGEVTHPSWCAGTCCDSFDESQAIHLRELPSCPAVAVTLSQTTTLMPDGLTVVDEPPTVIINADREPFASDLTPDDLEEAADVLRAAAERLRREYDRYDESGAGDRFCAAVDREHRQASGAPQLTLRL